MHLLSAREVKPTRKLDKVELRKPYILMIENDGGNGAALAISLGRAPDKYASWGGLRYATFHYAKFEDMIDGLRNPLCQDR
jgi:hypothetical protein